VLITARSRHPRLSMATSAVVRASLEPPSRREQWQCKCGRWHPLVLLTRNAGHLDREMQGLACPLCGSGPGAVV
jgi:hypothetical protein